MASKERRKLNLVFLGDKQTGKTALIRRLLNDAPNDPAYKVSVQQEQKLIRVDSDKTSFELHLIDTSGKERCRSTIASFIRHSTVFIVVYDVTDVETFRVTSKWVDVVRSEHGEGSIISLVGNKIERENERQVTTEEGQERADELKTMFIETSAVAGPNVTILFHKVVTTLLNTGEKVGEGKYRVSQSEPKIRAKNLCLSYKNPRAVLAGIFGSPWDTRSRSFIMSPKLEDSRLDFVGGGFSQKSILDTTLSTHQIMSTSHLCLSS